jgi:hypothetical protein
MDVVVRTLVLGYVRSRGKRSAVASAGNRRVDQVDQIGTTPEIIKKSGQFGLQSRKESGSWKRSALQCAGIPNGLMMVVLGSNFSFCAACITCKRKVAGQVLPFARITE